MHWEVESAIIGSDGTRLSAITPRPSMKRGRPLPPFCPPANFAATERIAKLIGEKDFTLLFHKGSRFNIHFGRINQDFILVTLFNNEVSLGLVRLGSIKAIEQMLPVLQAA